MNGFEARFSFQELLESLFADDTGKNAPKAKSWRRKRRQTTLEEDFSRRAKQDHEAGCSRPLGAKEKSEEKERERLSIGETAVVEHFAGGKAKRHETRSRRPLGYQGYEVIVCGSVRRYYSRLFARLLGDFRIWQPSRPFTKKGLGLGLATRDKKNTKILRPRFSGLCL